MSFPFLFIVLVSFTLYAQAAHAPRSGYCAVRYPVVLVHGISFSPNTPAVGYWGTIPRLLRSDGARVYLSGQLVYGSHEENAAMLKERIHAVLRESGAQRVNIIAHSKGGIESRYMISKLGMGPHVASLTTLCSPHRGSVVADALYREMNSSMNLSFLLAGCATFLSAVSGDHHAAPYIAGAQLSTAYMTEFNKTVVDDPAVYYQSYASRINEDYPSPGWASLYLFVYGQAGENDGVVSVSSARWGEYGGIISAGAFQHLSHSEVVCVAKRPGMDDAVVYGFYRTLVADLKSKGF